MSAHHCHAMWCKTSCAPRLLMCPKHWLMVPKELQDEVYRTVKLRGKSIDQTWAAWWRAQANAINHVAKIEKPEWPNHEMVLKRELDFADQLESP